MDKTTERLVLKLTLGFLLILTLVVGGFLVSALTADSGVVNSSSTQVVEKSAKTITAQEAIAIAQTYSDGAVEEVEINFIDGKTIYAVEIESQDSEVTVTIDGITKEVTKVDTEKDLSSSEIESLNPFITADQAASYALSAYMGTVTDISGKIFNENYVYEVELRNTQEEADVLVDMFTGAIVDVSVGSLEYDDEEDEREGDEEDDDEDEEEDNVIIPSNSRITEQEAKNIAVSELGGRVTDFEADSFKGKPAYEVELEVGRDEVDVIIDVQTGDILDIEWD